MKIIKANAEILTPIDEEWVLHHIERCYRLCYKTKEGNTEEFLRDKIFRMKHESPLEHFSFSVKFTCDRGVSHEIVRHRIASYSQESTRYCNYSKDKFGNEITVIEPCFLDADNVRDMRIHDAWEQGCEMAEAAYFNMLRFGAKPEEARSVLPNSLKTELVMTANLREWRHFFDLRCSPAAHPQIREVALIALEKASNAIPVVFDDLYERCFAVPTLRWGRE